VCSSDLDVIKELSRKVGSQSVVASIDAIKINDKYFCKIKDGTELVKISPKDLALEAEKLGCGEIIINSIDKDGTMSGYDIDMIYEISSNLNIPTVAMGGARNFSDFKKAIDIGKAHAVAAGSVFVYFGKLKAVLINFPDNKDSVILENNY
jgi:cyclase